MNSKKITFYLMTEKGFEALKSFISRFGAECIAEVIVEKDDSIENCFYDAIIQLCRQNKILYFKRNDNFKPQGEYAFAVSWRWMIKNYKNLIIFHDSLLPKYRGFAPLVNAMINGEKKIGVTAIHASEMYDEGNIVSQKSLHIKYPVKINELIHKVIPLYCELINEIAEKIANSKKIASQKQNEKNATYSLWRDEDDYNINWNEHATDIKRFIDAVGAPYKGASSYTETNKVRILDAEILPDKKIENRHAGKIIFTQNNMPAVVCGKGLLLIKQMIDDKTKKNLLPLKTFRVRFSAYDKRHMGM